MDETRSSAAAMYWCHMCNRRVDPTIELETIECPLCQSGFVEQMSTTISTSSEHHQIPDDYFLGGGGENGSESDRALSMWAPVLLGMMNNPRRRRRFRRRLELENDVNDILSSVDEGETELGRELQSFTSTRRRNSSTILQFLEAIRAGTTISDSNDVSEYENVTSERDMNEIRDRHRVILINPSNQAVILQGGNFRNRNQTQGGSLGDYFVGAGLDLLLQHLAENDPNRHGTAPAKKEAVEAMPTVKIIDNVQCSVCLDDLELGMEAKEMPCKHKFHDGCILPWLELHSSCPVCRYELPSDGRKTDSVQPTINNYNDSNVNSSFDDNTSSSGHNSGDISNAGGDTAEERNGRSDNRRGFTVPWPFNSWFSSSGNRGSSSSSSGTATRNSSSTDEN